MACEHEVNTMRSRIAGDSQLLLVRSWYNPWLQINLHLNGKAVDEKSLESFINWGYQGERVRDYMAMELWSVLSWISELNYIQILFSSPPFGTTIYSIHAISFNSFFCICICRNIFTSLLEVLSSRMRV